jgi:hypothetical protein
MSYSDFIKTHIKHIRCVICARTFGAQYDEILKTYPIYHPHSEFRRVLVCENDFYKELLRLYRFIHQSGESKTVRNVMDDYPWSSIVAMRKEMLEWCIRRGFFLLNNLKRLQVPPAIEDACKDLFAQLDLDDPDRMQNALDLLRAALRCFTPDLEKPDDEELPMQVVPMLRGESTLYDRIDTSNVELLSDRNGMATLFHQNSKR